MSEPLFEIIVREGDIELSRHSLPAGDHFAGTAVSCAIPIPLGAPGRKFTRISISRDGRVSLEDLESENGTMLDNLPIVMASWLPGHLVRFGELNLELWPIVRERIIAVPASPANPPVPVAPSSALAETAPPATQSPAAVLPTSAEPAEPTTKASPTTPMLVVKRRRAEKRSARMRGLLLFLALLAAAAGATYWKWHAPPESRPASTGADSSNLALNFYHQAGALVEEGRFEEALLKIAPALELDANGAEYYYLRGNILESLFRLSEAEESYSEALAHNANHQFAQQNRDLCREVLRTSPQGIAASQPARARLAQLMLAQGRLKEAERMEMK